MKIILALILLSYSSSFSFESKVDTNSVFSEARKYTYTGEENTVDTTQKRLVEIRKYYNNGILMSKRNYDYFPESKAGSYNFYNKEGNLIYWQKHENNNLVDYKELNTYNKDGKLIKTTTSWPIHDELINYEGIAETHDYFIYNSKGLLERKEAFNTLKELSHEFIYTYDINDSILSKSYYSYRSNIRIYESIDLFFRNQYGRLDSTKNNDEINSIYNYNPDNSYSRESPNSNINSINYYSKDHLRMKWVSNDSKSIFKYSNSNKIVLKESFLHSKLRSKTEYRYNESDKLIENKWTFLERETESITKYYYNKFGHLIKTAHYSDGNELTDLTTYEFIK